MAPPSRRVKAVVSGLVVAHLLVLFVSYFAVVRPSTGQLQLLAMAGPYLSAFHWAPEAGLGDGLTADGVPLYLARGEGAERVLRLETQVAGERETPVDGKASTSPLLIGEPSAWESPVWYRQGGSLATRRQQRFLAVLAQLGSNEQNSLAGLLVLPLLRHVDAAAAPASTTSVRVVRLPNLLTDVVMDNQPPPYQAVLIPSAAGPRLVRVPEPRLTAPASWPAQRTSGPSAQPGHDSSTQP